MMITSSGSACGPGPYPPAIEGLPSSVVFLEEGGVILYVYVANPDITTTRGIRVGSTESMVLSAYSTVERTTYHGHSGSVPLLLTFDAEGHELGFFLDGEGKVSAMRGGTDPCRRRPPTRLRLAAKPERGPTRLSDVVG